MPPERLPEVLLSGLATIAAGVLVGAGLSKLRHPGALASQISAYAVVPERAAAILGRLLPPVEIAAGTLLLAAPRPGGAVAAALFLGFAGAVGVNLARGRRDLHCGCFGPRGKARIGPAHLGGNLLGAAIAAGAAASGRPPRPAEIMLGVSIALSVVTIRLIVLLRELIKEVQPRAGA